MKKKYLAIFGVMPLLLGTIGSAQATTIQYSTTELIDITPGEDLWEYTYSVSDNTFAAGEGFTIYFDLGLYGSLNPIPLAPSNDWKVASWNPDPALPDNGAYAALAVVDGASLADVFDISFVWLGTGMPGPQYFEIHDSSFRVVETGYTTPIPVPPAGVLFGTVLVALMGYGKEQKTQK